MDIDKTFLIPIYFFQGYKCGMLSGLCAKESSLAVGLKSVSSQISNARIVFRLLDDYSMLNYTLQYGLGKHVRKQLLEKI